MGRAGPRARVGAPGQTGLLTTPATWLLSVVDLPARASWWEEGQAHITSDSPVTSKPPKFGRLGVGGALCCPRGGVA